VDNEMSPTGKETPMPDNGSLPGDNGAPFPGSEARLLGEIIRIPGDTVSSAGGASAVGSATPTSASWPASRKAAAEPRKAAV
jgi:hypothetical protein